MGQTTKTLTYIDDYDDTRTHRVTHYSVTDSLLLEFNVNKSIEYQTQITLNDTECSMLFDIIDECMKVHSSSLK